MKKQELNTLKAVIGQIEANVENAQLFAAYINGYTQLRQVYQDYANLEEAVNKPANG